MKRVGKPIAKPAPKNTSAEKGKPEKSKPESAGSEKQ